MSKFLPSMLKAGFAGLAVFLAFALPLAMPADEARAHDDNSAKFHAEFYPLHLAAGAGDLELVNHFIFVHGADVNEKYRVVDNSEVRQAVEGYSGLPTGEQAKVYRRLKELASGGNERARAFLEGIDQAETTMADGSARSVDENNRLNHGSTPLLRAAYQNSNATVAAALIEAGADVNAKDRTGNTPLHNAAITGATEMAKLLIAQGADVNVKTTKGGLTPLMFAVTGFKIGDESALDMVRLLIEHGASVHLKDDEGLTPLHEAAAENALEITKLLLTLGADVYVNEKDVYEETPLHRAAGSNAPEVIKLLLERGAYIEAKQERGMTPLHVAAHVGALDAAKFLLAAGANMKARSNAGDTPLDVVKKEKNWDSVALLERHARAASQKSQTESGNAETVFENTWRSVVVVFAGDTQGGGVVVGGPNQVATNCHVVDESPSDIRIYKGAARKANRDEWFSAEIVAGDRKRDVCILSVSGLWGIAAEFRTAGDLEIGESVYAVGAPQGFDFSISDGIVSQLRVLEGESAPLIQTSAAISPGSSGGGLFDSQGRLVGLTTWKIREGENLNFAVPVDWALELQ